MAFLRQHERLRVPQFWKGEERSFVAQIERIFDSLFNRKVGKIDLDDKLQDELNRRRIQIAIFKELDSKGNSSLSTLTAYPTSPGVYRVGAVISGLPTGTNGYGPLVIIDGGSYVMHLYMDARNDFFWARTSGTYSVATWRKVTGTDVQSIE